MGAVPARKPVADASRRTQEPASPQRLVVSRTGESVQSLIRGTGGPPGSMRTGCDRGWYQQWPHCRTQAVHAPLVDRRVRVTRPPPQFGHHGEGVGSRGIPECSPGPGLAPSSSSLPNRWRRVPGCKIPRSGGTLPFMSHQSPAENSSRRSPPPPLPRRFCRVRTGRAPMLRHASIGASGQALSDLMSFAKHPSFDLVAVADVDLARFERLSSDSPRCASTRTGASCSRRNTRTSTRSTSRSPTTCTASSRWRR